MEEKMEEKTITKKKAKAKKRINFKYTYENKVLKIMMTTISDRVLHNIDNMTIIIKKYNNVDSDKYSAEVEFDAWREYHKIVKSFSFDFILSSNNIAMIVNPTDQDVYAFILAVLADVNIQFNNIKSHLDDTLIDVKKTIKDLNLIRVYGALNDFNVNMEVIHDTKQISFIEEMRDSIQTYISDFEKIYLAIDKEIIDGNNGYNNLNVPIIELNRTESNDNSESTEIDSKSIDHESFIELVESNKYYITSSFYNNVIDAMIAYFNKRQKIDDNNVKAMIDIPIIITMRFRMLIYQTTEECINKLIQYEERLVHQIVTSRVLTPYEIKTNDIINEGIQYLRNYVSDKISMKKGGYEE